MSIKDIPQKINPVVNFKNKIYYGVKPYWQEKATPLISRVKESLDIKQDIFIALTIILVGLAGFGLGKLSALEKGREEIKISPAQVATSANGEVSFTAISSSSTNIKETSNTIKSADIPMSAAAMIASESAKGLLVASKNGQKYHFPWCAGASQISEKNKIWFNSYEEAQKAGYTPASNCKGLK